MQKTITSEDGSKITIDDEMFSPEAVNDRMARLVESFDMPSWILDDGKRCCNECGKPLAKVCVREVGLCLNAQNIGDIQVEIMCQECRAGYYLYFRKACWDFRSFIMAITPGEPPVRSITNPVQSTKLSSRDNNLTEIMVAEAKQKEATCPSSSAQG